MPDDMKVIDNDEAKQVDSNDYDNGSLKAHVDENDYDDQVAMEEHHALIQDRGNAPPPPNDINTLTLDRLDHFNQVNPAQNMLSSLQDSGGSSPNHGRNLGLDVMDNFVSANDGVQEILVRQLIEMGFAR